jgi:hypothetical protein
LPACFLAVFSLSAADSAENLACQRNKHIKLIYNLRKVAYYRLGSSPQDHCNDIRRLFISLAAAFFVCRSLFDDVHQDGGNMSLRSGVTRAVGSILLISVFSGLGLADTIRLKDGSIIKGRITSFRGGSFTVTMGEGSRKRDLTFAAAEIESIQFDSPAVPQQGADTTNRNASYTPPPPAPVVKEDTETPKIISPAVPQVVKPPVQSTGTGKMQPIVWTVKALADNTANGWTNTGWVVKKGQRIKITGDGTVSLGQGRTTTPSGLSTVEDPQKLLKNVPTGALVAVIGDDNNDFIYIGAEREFVATRDGALFLGINEGNLDDNSGAFDVKIEVTPGS